MLRRTDEKGKNEMSKKARIVCVAAVAALVVFGSCFIGGYHLGVDDVYGVAGGFAAAGIVASTLAIYAVLAAVLIAAIVWIERGR